MTDVKTIVVLGSGTMGHGIAQVAAMAGFATVLNDVSMDLLQKAHDRIVENLKKGVEKGKVTEADAKAAAGRVSLVADIERSVGNADLVIEAIPERIELKLETFSRVDKAAPGHAILASNTSALSITEMAAGTSRPRQFVGMHFFNPVHLMKLVEIVRGLETSQETFKTAEAVAQRMGKETVDVRESPGFITSRINAMIGN